MSERALCRSCNAAIFFATTPKGKQIPLDLEPVRLVVLDEDTARPGESLAVVRACYRPHFATCPAAAAHRKPKREGAAPE